MNMFRILCSSKWYQIWTLFLQYGVVVLFTKTSYSTLLFSYIYPIYAQTVPLMARIAEV